MAARNRRRRASSRRLSRTNGAAASKQDAICNQIYDRIAAGSLRPGDRLPTRAEIEAMFDTTKVTVQRAFARLLADGVVVARGRQGTFVSEDPPQLCNYGLVFPDREDEKQWNKFWRVIHNVASEIVRQGKRRLTVYTGVSKGSTAGDFPQLLEDIEQRRLAGLLFVSPPFLVASTPVVDAPGLARVALMPPTTTSHIPAIGLESGCVLVKSLDRLQERGRRRIALITQAGQAGPLLDAFHAQIAARGLETKAHWVQVGSLQHPEWSRNQALALFHDDVRARPDGLIVTDDNLTEHVYAGVLAAGRRMPEDLDFVSHCNFPPTFPEALPIHLVGFDVWELLLTAFHYLDRQRAGEPVPASTVLPARFAEELERPARAVGAQTSALSPA